MSTQKRKDIIGLLDLITGIEDSEKEKLASLIMEMPEENLDKAMKYISDSQDSITGLINEKIENIRMEKIESEENADKEKDKTSIENIEQMLKDNF